MYKQLSLNGIAQECVVRLHDNAIIPFAPANTDYQEYLHWLEEGNVPLPADDGELTIAPAEGDAE